MISFFYKRLTLVSVGSGLATHFIQFIVLALPFYYLEVWRLTLYMYLYTVLDMVDCVRWTFAWIIKS